MANREDAPWRCLSRGWGCSRHQGNERGRGNIGSRNGPILLIGQDRKASDAVVLMGMWAKFTRMDNGERLPGQDHGRNQP